MLKRALPLAAVAVIQIALLVVAAVDEPTPLTPAQKRAKRADVGGPFPLELRSPQVVAGSAQRVLVALRRPSLAELNARQPQSPTRQRAYVRSLGREAKALISALEAKGVAIGRPVLFARVWSGFAATIATDDLPAVQALGVRVEPVSRFYPAQVPADDAPPVRPLPTTATKFGRIAILDAFPRGRPAAHGATAGVAAHFLADATRSPAEAKASVAERAGPRISAVVAGELPKAKLDWVRVAGRQARENGKFEVFGTTDQLIDGLERVTDPDQDGDSSDAASVAVMGVSAPYSGFENSAISTAVDGAAELGTLVVAPAGNGGNPDGPFGSIGAPGAADGALTVGALDSSGEPADASSTGPTYSLGPKPDLAISGGASTSAGTSWGSAIAAARVTGVAAALRAERPKLTPVQAAAALIGTAAPRGEPLEDGGGDPLLQAARATPFVVQPSQVVLLPGHSTHVRIVGLGGSGGVFAPSKQPDGITLTRDRSGVRIQAGKDAASGRIDLGPIKVPYTVLDQSPPPPPLGRPEVITHQGKPEGVRFTAGSIERQDKGTSVIPVGNLVLTLSGPVKRELTPPGGARDLLPGEYAYTLTDAIRSQLQPGVYRFVLRARGTAGSAVVSRRSRPFRVG